MYSVGMTTDLDVGCGHTTKILIYDSSFNCKGNIPRVFFGYGCITNVGHSIKSFKLCCGC
jgi:hypothetical protein